MNQEGKVVLEKSDIFFSSFQRIHRDVTLLILRRLLSSQSSPRCAPLRYLDLFSGNGIRSLRFVKEVYNSLFDDNQVEVVGIDSKKDCVETATRNAKLNNVSHVSNYIQLKVNSKGQSLHEKCNSLGRFDIIDIDPFGSSIPYVAQCLSLLRHDGLLLLTCTDAKELFGGKGIGKKYESSGTFETHGVRRPAPTIASHEFGLRSALTASCHIICCSGMIPTVVASWVYSHGCRIILRIRKPSPGLPLSEDMSLWLPLSYVYTNAVRGLVFIGELIEQIIIPFESIALPIGKCWWKVGPLWSTSTVDLNVIEGVLTYCKQRNALNGLEVIESAMLLLDRMWKDNIFFRKKRTDDSTLSGSCTHFFSDADSDVTFNYSWGVFVADRNNRHNRAGCIDTEAELSLKESNHSDDYIQLYEDHKFYKVV